MSMSREEHVIAVTEPYVGHVVTIYDVGDLPESDKL